MSKELKQLAKLVEVAEHDRTLDDRFDYLDTITEHLDALKAILARMQALEAVYVAALDHGDNTPYCRCECCIEKYPREDALGRAVKVIEDADIAAK